MKLLDLTFPGPDLNLACDEALLDWSETTSHEEILRFWESQTYFVVLGFSGKIDTEVNIRACQRRRVPIFRRSSGGGAVLQGSGCLNYSLILKVPDSGPLTRIDGTHSAVLQRHTETLRKVTGADIAVRGVTDLAVGDKKFSGNAQRRRRSFLLYHGTFLLRFDIDQIENFLFHPSKEPAYRHGRPHREFLTNLNFSSALVKKALAEAWGPAPPLGEVPFNQIEDLARARFSSHSWRHKA